MKTTRLTTSRAASWPDHLPLPPALIVAVLVLIAAAGIAAIGRIGLYPNSTTMPTPALATAAPLIIIASPLPQMPPTALPAARVAVQRPANVTTRAIVVYGGPDMSTAIGAVEAGRPYQIVARWGIDWLKLNLSGSGLVFARTSDLLDLPADLVDLQPAPAPRMIYVAAQAAAPVEAAPAPATIYQNMEEPTPAETAMPPQQLVILDREQWALDAQRARP